MRLGHGIGVGRVRRAAVGAHPHRPSLPAPLQRPGRVAAPPCSGCLRSFAASAEVWGRGVGPRCGAEVWGRGVGPRGEGVMVLGWRGVAVACRASFSRPRSPACGAAHLASAAVWRSAPAGPPPPPLPARVRVLRRPRPASEHASNPCASTHPPRARVSNPQPALLLPPSATHIIERLQLLDGLAHALELLLLGHEALEHVLVRHAPRLVGCSLLTRERSVR